MRKLGDADPGHVGEIRGIVRCRVLFQIGRARAGDQPERAEADSEEAGFLEPAGAQAEVESRLDDIGNRVLDRELYLDFCSR
jgi:hypothetical protein